MRQNILATITEHLSAAIQTIAPDEDVRFAVSMTAFPEGAGRFMPVLVFLVSMPGVEIGDRIASTIVSGNLEPVEEEIQQMVREQIETLRQTRSSQLTEGLGEAGKLLSGKNQ